MANRSKRQSKSDGKWLGAYFKVRYDSPLFPRKDNWLAVVKCPDDTEAGAGVRPIATSGMLVKEYIQEDEARIAGARAVLEAGRANAQQAIWAKKEPYGGLNPISTVQRVSATEMHAATGASLAMAKELWQETEEEPSEQELPSWTPEATNQTVWIVNEKTGSKFGLPGQEIYIGAYETNNRSARKLPPPRGYNELDRFYGSYL